MKFGVYSKGSFGPSVKLLQMELDSLGYSVSIDGDYGPDTEAAVKLFQKHNGLVEDGIAGPITLGKMFPNDAVRDSISRAVAPTALAEKVIEVAKRYVGVRETRGYNRSPEIDAWTKELGLDELGLSWCMIFVQHCYWVASKELGVKDVLRPDTAGVMDLWYKVPKSWQIHPIDGLPGDIIIIDHGEGKGHTGIVTGYGAGVYDSIEGNTNVAGSREGDGVYEKTREYTELKGLIRVPAL
jgi:peptidoglycan hydrolase-like protein with peptidoglycan-binding domain